jgi:hypothetical protein
MFLTIPYSRDMRARVKIIEAGKTATEKDFFRQVKIKQNTGKGGQPPCRNNATFL